MIIYVNENEAEDFEPSPDYNITLDFFGDVEIGLDTALFLDAFFSSIKDSPYDGELRLKLYPINKQIDLCVFGILILILTTKPKTKIIFDFDHETYDDTLFQDPRRLESTIKQYLASAIMVSKDLNFYIKVNSHTDLRITDIPSFYSWRTPSSKFLPLLLINNTTNELLFDTDYFWKTKKDLIDHNSSIYDSILPVGRENVNSQLYEHLRESYFSGSTNFSLIPYIIINYVKLLSDLRSFTLIFENKNILDTHVNLSQRLKENRETPFHTKSRTGKNFRNNREYFLAIENIHFLLRKQPAIFVMMFSSIARQYISEIRSEDRVQINFVKNFLETLKNIYKTTEEICFGLKELFQNVVSHSTNKTGVFLCRIFEREHLISFKSLILPDISTYIESLSKIEPKNKLLENLFLDINVFDLSNKGILQRYKEKDEGEFGLIDIYQKTDKSPEHSVKRLEEKIGLILYNNTIQNLSGYFYVSTPDNGNLITYCSASESHESEGFTFRNGSHYNILVPLFNLPSSILNAFTLKHQGYTAEKAIGTSRESGDKTNIWEYETTIASKDYIKENGKVILQIDISEFNLEAVEEKYEPERKLISEINKCLTKINAKEIIPVLDFGKCNETKIKGNTSLLKRIVNQLNEKDVFPGYINDFIITGISFENFKRIVELFKIQGDNWGIFTKVFLFYVIHDNYYIPILLTGCSYEEFRIINERVLKIKLDNAPISDKASVNLYDRGEFNKSCLFYFSPYISLKEFDVLLKFDGISYFEIFAKKCLEKTIDEDLDLSETNIYKDTRLQGYKIANGHFKLGSKIHISDFYYAKRMFQINEFATKYAFLVVNYLFTNKDLKVEAKIEEGLTILGYAKYSDLLIYKIKELLQILSKAEINKINLNIIQDAEELNLLHLNSEIKGNILLVIPISSTFSTSFKIEKHLKEKGLYVGAFDLPIINIIDVADKTAVNNYTSNPVRIIEPKDKILYQFGWRKIDYEAKTVRVASIAKGLKTESLQKYFIQLFTNWYSIEDCEICFGNKAGIEKLEELPLVETDKASVTPQLIFGEGLKYSFASYKNASRLTENAAHYGHYKIDKRHNAHFIDPRKFLEPENVRENLAIWLDNIKTNNWFKEIDGNVTIITPDGIYNSEFVYIVNEVLFGAKANIIKYDPTNDFIANFQKFYSDIVSNSDFLIYVDDQISSGTTFENISRFIESCVAQNNQKQFTAILTLICRSDDNTLIELSRYFSSKIEIGLSYINWYKYLRLPTIISNHLPCPICVAQEYYYELSETAALDPTKYYLFKKGKKLNYQISLDNIDRIFHSYDNRIEEEILLSDLTESQHTVAIASFLERPYSRSHLLKLIIENNLYKQNILSKEGIRNIEDIDELSKNIFKNFSTEYELLYSEEEVLLVLIKVLSFSPFINHYEIRKAIFKKLISLLDKTFSEIVQNPIITVTKLRVLKLLLKRISSLKGNYLIRQENFEKLLDFYKAHEKTKEFEKEKNLDTLINKHVKEIIINLQLFDTKDKWRAFFSTDDNFNRNLIPGKENASYTKTKSIVKNRISEIEEIRKNKITATKDHFYSETILDIMRRFRRRFLSVLKELKIEPQHENEDIQLQSITYSCRALKNLEYKRRIRTDFHYFIAHLIKEITHNNEAKAIHLDKMFTEQHDKFSKTDAGLEIDLPINFRQLIRIIKLENIGILKKFSDKINEEIEQTSTFNKNEVTNDLAKVKKTIETPEVQFLIQPLLQFLRNEKIACNERDTEMGDISLSFAHYILLKQILEKDNKALIPKTEFEESEIKLNQKISYLLERIKDILKLDAHSLQGDTSTEIYLFVRFKPIVAQELIKNTDIIFYPQRVGSGNSFSLETSFVLKVFNGLSLRERGGTQNIFEFRKPTSIKSWESLKNYYTNNSGEVFEDSASSYFMDTMSEGNIFKDTHTHLLFYRVSDLKFYKSDNDIDLVNNCQAVILVASQRKRFLKAEKLRYLTLLKDSLSAFLKHHYTNDSFREYMEESIKNYQWNAYSHGWANANESMKNLIRLNVNDETTKFEFELANLLQVQSTIIMQFQRNTKAVDFWQEISRDDMVSLCRKIGHYIFNSSSYKPRKIRALPEFNLIFSEDFTFEFNPDLLKIILSEIFSNFKKNTEDIADSELFFSMAVSNESNNYFISLQNSYRLSEEQNKQDILQKMSDKMQSGIVEPHGTDMIDTIYKSILQRSDFFCEPFSNSKVYLNMLPIFKYKKK